MCIWPQPGADRPCGGFKFSVTEPSQIYKRYLQRYYLHNGRRNATIGAPHLPTQSISHEIT